MLLPDDRVIAASLIMLFAIMTLAIDTAHGERSFEPANQFDNSVNVEAAQIIKNSVSEAACDKLPPQECEAVSALISSTSFPVVEFGDFALKTKAAILSKSILGSNLRLSDDTRFRIDDVLLNEDGSISHYFVRSTNGERRAVVSDAISFHLSKDDQQPALSKRTTPQSAFEKETFTVDGRRALLSKVVGSKVVIADQKSQLMVDEVVFDKGGQAAGVVIANNATDNPKAVQFFVNYNDVKNSFSKGGVSIEIPDYRPARFKRFYRDLRNNSRLN